MARTCLVIGCSGQDGSYLSKSLLKKGFTVVGTSRSEHKHRKNHRILGIEDEFKIMRLNLNKKEEIKEVIIANKPDIIYNLSAQSSVGISFDKPLETQVSIVNSTANLLEACRELSFNGVLFFAGSSEIFGNTEPQANINSYISPMSPYALAKYQSFELVKLYRKIYNLRSVTGILFNHESPLRDKRFVTHKVINSAIECSKDKNKKFQFGNIEIVRDWGWAEEYVEAMQAIANQSKLKDHLICTGIGVSLQDIIELSFKQFDLDWREHIEINQNLIRKNEILKSIGDPKSLLQDLKWKPNLEIKEIIKKLISSSI